MRTWGCQEQSTTKKKSPRHPVPVGLHRACIKARESHCIALTGRNREKRVTRERKQITEVHSACRSAPEPTAQALVLPRAWACLSCPRGIPRRADERHYVIVELAFGRGCRSRRPPSGASSERPLSTTCKEGAVPEGPRHQRMNSRWRASRGTTPRSGPRWGVLVLGMRPAA